MRIGMMAELCVLLKIFFKALILISCLPILFISGCAKMPSAYYDCSTYNVKQTEFHNQGKNYLVCKNCVKYTQIHPVVNYSSKHHKRGKK